MQDLLRQRKYLTHQHATMECLLALHGRGVLAALPASGEGAAPEMLAREHGCEPRILAALLDYVALTTPFVERVNDRYRARPESRGKLLSFMLDMAYAYDPVFRALPDLLCGAKAYGRDVQRNGEALGRASGFATRNTIPVIARRFAERGVRHVIDLGCGGGEVLAALCNDGQRRGTGVDIDAATAESARANLRAAGLSDRTEVVVADLADAPTLLTPDIEGPVGICSTGVVHELLRDGDDAFIDVMRRWRARFPDATFCIAEFDAVPFDALAATDSEETLMAASYYQLIHPLSAQGDPQPVERWRALFARAGFTVAHEDAVPIRFVVFTLT